MRFYNRTDAAMQLAEHLEKYKGQNAVILAVPRGGVPLGYHLAQELKLPLDLLMTKKIGHPLHPEFAIGAVSLHDEIVTYNDVYIPDWWINSEIQKIRVALNENYRLFMGDRKPVDVSGKTVILVDDGIATGNTLLASVKMFKTEKVSKVVIAVPVAPLEAAQKIKAQVDELVCILTPAVFFGVGLHYHDFTQVTDEEVIELLKSSLIMKE